MENKSQKLTLKDVGDLLKKHMELTDDTIAENYLCNAKRLGEHAIFDCIICQNIAYNPVECMECNGIIC